MASVSTAIVAVTTLLEANGDSFVEESSATKAQTTGMAPAASD